MTKRFTLFEDLDILDNNTGKIISPCLDKGLSELIDLLNQLNNENEQLKQQREELFIRERDTKNDWRELKQENEQLKAHNQYLIELLESTGAIVEIKKGDVE